ncbi:MAG: adenylosuccinate lyase family protein, partial [Alphaproteobacteria bacterium]|nr:adenylosuccinate lyase family protein [Alphaproteobacteria bacterium]
MSAWSFASQVYGSAWSTPAMRAIFDDAPRLRGWLEILATLADVQGESGLIPADAARDVASTCRAIEPNQDFLCGLEEDYRTSGHSTAGLIAAIASRCPGTSGQWVYYGVTVQDVADTWTMIALRDAGRLLRGDLTRVADAASAIAGTHRNTVMAGRTHGQQGLPITFGFKAAGWLVELRRHQERLGQVSKRMEIGQLCGGVGSLSSLGPNALEIQRKFCERLGLRT